MAATTRAARFASLVADGFFTAEQAATVQRRIRRDERTAAARLARQEADIAEWRSRKEESDRMATTWARFVMVHCPGFGDLVVHSGLPLREAVTAVEALTGCEPLRCRHLLEEVGQ